MGFFKQENLRIRFEENNKNVYFHYLNFGEYTNENIYTIQVLDIDTEIAYGETFIDVNSSQEVKFVNYKDDPVGYLIVVFNNEKIITHQYRIRFKPKQQIIEEEKMEVQDSLEVIDVEVPTYFTREEMPLTGRDGFYDTLNILKKYYENPTIVEIGSMRNDSPIGDGESTRQFAWYVNAIGGVLFSVDIDWNVTNFANNRISMMDLYKRYNILILNNDAIDFLAKFPNTIDFLYLDAWDYTSYGNGIDGKAYSAVKHLEAFLLAEPKLSENAIILIDDMHTLDEGKGSLVIPYMLKKGYKLIHKSYQYGFQKNG